MMKQAIYLVLYLILVSCGQPSPDKVISPVTNTNTALTDSIVIQNLLSDTVELKETFNFEDLPANDYLTERLKPIRTNFKRINSIENWTTIDSEDVYESLEGGEIKYYYLDGKLEKIIARHYGETFQLLTEYYLLNDQLSFVFEKRYKYNRHFLYDTIDMKENNDTEAFDFDKSEIIEDRNYFENGKLLHQISSQDCGAPFSDDYILIEQKRLQEDFDKYTRLKNLDKKTNR